MEFLDRIGDEAAADINVWNDNRLGCMANSVELLDGRNTSGRHEGVVEVNAHEVSATEFVRQVDHRGEGRSQTREEMSRIDRRDRGGQHGNCGHGGEGIGYRPMHCLWSRLEIESNHQSIWNSGEL